jgi:protein KRI1
VDENGKPVWDDDIDISDIVPEEDYAPGGEAYDPTAAGPSGKKSRADRKKEKKDKKRDKGKGRSAEEDTQTNLLDAEELDAVADPEHRARVIEQYVDEYYKLDHEDLVSFASSDAPPRTDGGPVSVLMGSTGRRPSDTLSLHKSTSQFPWS